MTFRMMAGLALGLLALAGPPPAHSALPAGETRVGVAGQVLAALHDAGVAEAYGFVNGVQGEREPESLAVLSLWRAAGQPLANHTWSHMALSANGLEAFRADLIRNEALLERHMPQGGWRWLRFPYLDEGDTPQKRDGVRRFLAARGYRIASVTLSFDDYAWNEPYARCVAQGDAGAIAALEASYLKAAEDSLDYSRDLSTRLHGKDIPYVLLLHTGGFGARMAPRLLALYRRRGATFVTLDQAQRHPFYRDDFRPRPTPGPTTLEAALKARGLAVPAKPWSVRALEGVCR